jgi:AAA domain/Primase C terminal 2 (PriCT-2)/RepB DNA-primase N-terminal domain
VTDYNSAESVRFLKLLDGNAASFTFQTFAEKGDSISNVIPKVIHDDLALAKLRPEHVSGAGIYITANETDGCGRKTENIVRVRAVWQEDDDGYDGAFPLEPSIVVESSPGHFHRYWLVTDDWPTDDKGRADFAAVMERMVESFGSDKNAKDISRVLRLPGFYHRKGAPFMVRIIGGNGKRYTRAEIMAGFPPVAREGRAPGPAAEFVRGGGGDEIERIREALSFIDPDPRYLWRNVGMALKEHLGEAGRSLWDEWSRGCRSKFNERRQDSAWRSFRRHDIRIGTLFHHAKQGGWQTQRPHDGNQLRTEKPTSSTARKLPEIESPPVSPSPWRGDAFSARQLREMNFPPVAWLLPGIIPGEGLTLLCSKPKFGKSWLAYDLCIASTMDRFTLGTLKPAQGDALYLALEDSKRRLQSRMRKLLPGFSGAWSEHLTISTKWRRLHEGGLDDIRDWHAETKKKGNNPILVVIDVLAKVRQAVGGRQIYEADYQALGTLSELAHELGVAVIAIHHTRKMAADDLMETVSGSYGTSGAADTILVMANQAGASILFVVGRDVESAELAIQFAKESCKWTILGKAAEVCVSEQRSKVINALKEANAPMTVLELMLATAMKRNPLDVLLSKMVRDDLILRVKVGTYAHKDYVPPDGSTEASASVRSFRSVPRTTRRGQKKRRGQILKNKEENVIAFPSVRSFRESTSENTSASGNPPVQTQADRTDGQMAPQGPENTDESKTPHLSASETDGDRSIRSDRSEQTPDKGADGKNTPDWSSEI